MRTFIALAVALYSFPSAACAPACDLDKDGATGTASDYGVFFGAFGKSKGESGFKDVADLDGDGAVTPTDWGLLQKFCPLGS